MFTPLQSHNWFLYYAHAISTSFIKIGNDGNDDPCAGQDFDTKSLALSLSDISSEHHFSWRQLRIEETYPLKK
jgi:hypothetical protein